MTPQLPGSDQVRYLQALNWEDWLAPLRKRWLAVAAFALAGLACAAALLRFFPDVYIAQAVLRFIPPQVPEKFVAANDAMQAEQRLFALTQLLTSSLTARKTIEAFGLYPERRRFVPVADLVPRFQKALRIRKVAGQDRSRSVLSVSIAFEYSEPEKAKQVVLQLVETVHEMNRRYRGDQSIGTTDFLAAQTEAARRQVEEVEDRILELGMADRLSGVHHWSYRVEGLAGLDYRLARLQSQIYDLQNERNATLEEAAATEGQIRRVAVLVTLRTEPPTLDLLRLRQEFDTARANASILRKRYTPQHPLVVEAEAVVSQAEKALEWQLEKDVDSARERLRRQFTLKLEDLRARAAALDNSIRAVQAEHASLSQKAAAMRAGAAAVPEDELEYARLLREQAFAREFYQSLLRKQKESETASEMERIGRGETVEMIEPPEAPLHPEQPDWIVKLLLGTAVGLLAGIAFVIWPVLANPRVRAKRHLAFWGPVPLLAELPGQPLLLEAAAGRGGPRWRLPWRQALARVVAVAVVLTALATSTSCGLVRASKEELLRRGKSSRQAGDLRTAALFFRKAIAEDRRFGPAYEALAGTLIEMGEFGAAYSQLTRAAELLPQEVGLQTRLAELTYEMYFSDPGRPRMLLSELEELGTRISQRWPARPEGYRYLGQVLIERGRTTAAVELLNRGIEKAGAVPSLIVELASAEHRRGRFEEAERLLSQLVDGNSRYEPAFDLLYLHLMDQRKMDEAGEVLRKKWNATGRVDAALQLAAHQYAMGNETELTAHLAEVDRLYRNQPEALARIGDFWLHRGRYDLANSAYSAGLELHSRHRTLFTGRLVELKLAQQNRGEALRLIEAESTRNPADLTLAVYRAAMELDTSDASGQKRVRRQLEAILSRMPRSAFVRFHLGRAYLKLGELARAGEEFETCIRLDPNYAPGWLALAETDLARGLVARAESSVNKIIVRAPAFTPALVLKARLDSARGRFRSAEQALEAVAPPDQRSPEVLSARGEIRLVAGQWKEAADLFERALKAAPGQEQAVLGLARARLAGGQEREALRVVERASASYPGSTAFRSARAAIAMRIGELETALREYRKLSSEAPGSVAYQLGVADALALGGKLEEAIVEYGKAERLDPRDPRPWLRRAAVAASLGRNGEAEAALGGVLSRDGSNPFALNNLAYLLAREGRELNYALQLAEQAGRLLPGSAEVQDTLAYLYLRLGMREKAVEAFDRMIAHAAEERKQPLLTLRAKTQRGELQQAARLLEEARDKAASLLPGAKS